MQWIKAFHIVFVIAWFAGLLYLPRLFVYHAEAEDLTSQERFKVMERRLFGIMSIGGAGATIFGGWLLTTYGWGVFESGGWLPAKLALVGGLIAFHLYCFKIMRAFAEDRNSHHPKYYRIINEVPALAMVAIVILVVVKPF